MNAISPPVPTSIAGLPQYFGSLGGGAFIPIVVEGVTYKATVSQISGAGLDLPLSIENGGTAGSSATAARVNLGAAASGSNTDITSLNSPYLGAEATAGTQTPGDSSEFVATTMFVSNAIASAGGVITGAGIIWFSSTPPLGYLECNGQAVSRATYSTLFAAIGTVWGVGDGTTTFNVPDTRGYFLRGWDDGAGIDPARTFASTQAYAIQSHTHTASVTDPGHVHPVPLNTWVGTDGVAGSPSSPVAGSGASTESAVTGISVTNANTGGSETRPVNVAIMFCIKT